MWQLISAAFMEWKHICVVFFFHTLWISSLQQNRFLGQWSWIHLRLLHVFFLSDHFYFQKQQWLQMNATVCPSCSTDLSSSLCTSATFPLLHWEPDDQFRIGSGSADFFQWPPLVLQMSGLFALHFHQLSDLNNIKACWRPTFWQSNTSSVRNFSRVASLLCCLLAAPWGLTVHSCSIWSPAVFPSPAKHTVDNDKQLCNDNNSMQTHNRSHTQVSTHWMWLIWLFLSVSTSCRQDMDPSYGWNHISWR